MADDEILLFVAFICDRFIGYVPDAKMLKFALDDWRTEMNHEWRKHEGKMDGE